jgi:hypothetical protein
MLTPAPAQRQKTVVLCLPGERFPSLWVNGLVKIVSYFWVKGMKVITQFGFSSNVYVTRNSIWTALKALEDVDYVVWLDDDNLVTPEQVDRLLTHLDTDEGLAMAAGWCWIHPEGYVADYWPSFGMFEGPARFCRPIPIKAMESLDPGVGIIADYTGFPLVVHRGDLLGIMEDNPFRAIVDSRLPGGQCGEDIAFCRRLQESTGKKILVDRSVQVVHLKQLPAGPQGRVAEAVPVPVLVAGADEHRGLPAHLERKENR